MSAPSPPKPPACPECGNRTCGELVTSMGDHKQNLIRWVWGCPVCYYAWDTLEPGPTWSFPDVSGV